MSTSRGPFDRKELPKNAVITNTSQVDSPFLQRKPSKSLEATKLEFPSGKLDLTLAGFLFVVSTIMMVGHHFYLSFLDGRHVQGELLTQKNAQRLSLLQSMAVKLCLAILIGLALRQQQWYILRNTEKGIRIHGIDALLSLGHRLESFAAVDVWKYASPAIATAAIIYVLPLLTIFVPTALTVTTAVMQTTLPCRIPTVNFRVPRNDLYTVDYTGGNFKTTSPVNKLASLTALTGQELTPTSPCGSNCSFDLQLTGFAWKCTDHPKIKDKSLPWGDEWDADYLWWQGNLSAADTLIDDGYNADGTVYINTARYKGTQDSATGYFWIGHQFTRNGTACSFPDRLSGENASSRITYGDVYSYEVFSCRPWDTTYSLQYDYINNIGSYTIKNLVYNYNATDGLTDSIYMGTNTAFLNYKSLHNSMSALLTGTITWVYRSGICVAEDTSINIMPGLSRPDNYSADGSSPLQYLRAKVEELSHNYTLSFLAATTLGTYNTTESTCRQSNTAQVWKYDQKALLIPYAIALGLVVLAVIQGAVSMAANGSVAPEAIFSTAIIATAHSGLHELMRDDRRQDNLLRARLRYARTVPTHTGELQSGACAGLYHVL